MDNEIMTTGEAAQFLKTSKTYVFKMIREGELPVIKRGKRYTRLMKTDLMAFLKRHRKGGIPVKEVRGESSTIRQSKQ